MCLSVVCVTESLIVQISVISVACLVLSEAARTSTVFSKVVGSCNVFQAQKQDFVYLMTQFRSRKVVVGNFLFNFNWNVLVAVKCHF